MESNGKGVDVDGNKLTIEAGEIGFGQPGTNGQHSFFQVCSWIEKLSMTCNTNITIIINYCFH